MLKGDEAELFKAHAAPLRAAVRRHVNTSDAIIEDACSFARLQLMRRQPDRETVFGWLRTTAVHEAWRLHRIAARDLHGDSVADNIPAVIGDPTTALRLRQLSDAIARLTPHQRTVLQLLIAGHSYNEIADLQSISHGSVNKALVRARRHLRLVHSTD
jgi:RNA polymerase sigma factor (sigma-70 family)